MKSSQNPDESGRNHRNIQRNLDEVISKSREIWMKSSQNPEQPG